MENYGYNKQEDSIFTLGIDEQAREYMFETVKWGKFLAIVGFIFLAILILIGLLSGLVFSSFGPSNAFSQGMGIGMMIVYLMIAGIYFYPTWALYKFSVMSKQALTSYNQEQFNESLRYLKNIFKFFGIVSIVILAIYALALIFGFFGAMMTGA